MRVVQIHDKTQDGHALAFDLRDVLAALGHRVLRAYWSVSGVDSHGEDLAARALEPLLLRTWPGPARG